MNRPARPLSHRPPRRAHARLLRVVLLAFVLVLANTLAPWSMAHAAPAAQTSADHCHDADAAKKPAPSGSSCPCCAHDCQCFGTAAPLPQFLALRPPAPDTTLVRRDIGTPPAPPIAEQLRPPIA